MTPAAPNPPHDERVLVLAPTGRDAPLACEILFDRAGAFSESCPNIESLCQEIARGAGALVIAAEVLDDNATNRLIDALAGQLPWSDLPLIILSGQAEADLTSVSLARLRQRGNVTVLDRPVRIVTLVSAVQSALRARRRQYEVRDLLAQTRAAIRQRDQFLAMLGHELRNPLATISTALSVVDAAAPTSEQLELEQREIIRRQTAHLARLVDDLLDVSRITSGKVVLRRAPVDLVKLATAAIAIVEPSARQQQHQVTLKVAAPSVLISADSVRIEQVLNNLLTNAIKYTPRGGVISVSVEPAGDQALLRVRDNGVGMSPELLPRVFDLFTQADRSLDRSQGGMGIGLTLVRTLVELHGGTVTASSEGLGRGSEFVVSLPLAKSLQPRPQTESSPKPPGGRRVLVVEDNRDSRRAMQCLLEFWGYSVAVAEDGPGGVAAADSIKPDVAFVDVGLPGYSGYDVARRIRSSLGESIQLIALTGYGQPEDRDEALAAGFDLHLTKPVDPQQLAKILAETTETAPST